ncbi:MAG: hypothetical protein OHK0039_15880 [Bacteroidia bacterium]
MKLHRTAAFLLSLCLLATPALHAQSCAAYERELELYFYEYRPGMDLDQTRIERLRLQCGTPTPKLELIYFYFRAAHALYANPGDRRALEDAIYFYDQCAAHFDYFLDAGAGDQLFFERFYQEADILEQRIAQEARRQNFRRENRYYGDHEVAAVNWLGSQRGVQAPAPNLRTTQAQDEGAFVKHYLRDGHYVALDAPDEGVAKPRCRCGEESTAQRVASTETFGYVGQVADLNIIEYLHFRQSGAGFTYPVAEETGATLRIATTEPTRGMPADYRAMTNVMDQLSLRVGPGTSSPEVARLGFGQIVAVVDETLPLTSYGKTYVQVRTHDGHTGWVDRAALVAEGQVAVLVQDVRGYPALMDRSDRNALIFRAGELVVLADTRREGTTDWVQVVGRNAEKTAWLMGIDALSIEELDLQIGEAMYLAIHEASLYARKARLEAIRQLPGYAQSELAPVVEYYLRQLYAYNS